MCYFAVFFDKLLAIVDCVVLNCKSKEVILRKMTTHIGARTCFFCGVSTVRGPRRRSQRPIQSYLLTEDYVANHLNIIDYARYLFDDRQIMVQDRICRPCLQRANRFVETYIKGTVKKQVMQEEKGPQEEEKAALASRQAVIPSFSQNRSELQNDPLRDTPQEYFKHILIKEEYIAPEQTEEMPVREEYIASERVEAMPLETEMPLKKEYIAPEQVEAMSLETEIPLKKEYIAPEQVEEAMPLVTEMPHKKEYIAPEQAKEILKTKMPPKTKVPVISVPGFSRMPFSSTNCIKAGCNNRQNLHRINSELRTNILLKQNLYIQNGVRVCEEHLRDTALWLDLAIHGRTTIETFNSAQIANMLQMLQKTNLQYLKLNR